VPTVIWGRRSAAEDGVAESEEESQPGRGRGAAKPARRKSRASRGGTPRSLPRRLAYWGAVLCVWGLILGAATIGLVVATLPPIQSLTIPKRPPTIQMVGLDGKVLADRGEMPGTSVSLKDLPPTLPRAFMAIEDRRFYHHFGVDPIGLTRALIADVLHRGAAQGGSTITQQLAKNLFLTHERTVWRKLQELVLALWIERKLGKDQILELYLNRVYFGSGAYGVEAASQRYFGKPARDVKLGEAAMLAGLVKSPSRLAPSRNPAGAERRAQIVLAAMAEAGFITESAATTAIALGPPAIRPAGAGTVNYVADWIMDVLDDLVGRIEEDIKVETTIDPVLQAAAEKAVVEELAQKGAKFGIEQGALVAMTPDGAVRAMVGGRNYAESQFNRAVAAKRQPGSAFKPFVYLTALEHGLTPDSVREDRPIALKGWRPENYGRQYYGPVTLTQALALSLNTVSVRLTLELGPAKVAKTAYRLGIASKLDPNPSLALGTSEVSLIELVSAYAPFANGGSAIAAHVVERVRTASGKTLYTRAAPNFGRVIDARYVGMMNAMMHETLAIGTAKSAQLPGWPAAGKTGTSQEFRDAWFIGYTQHLITGVWLGNDDSSPTKKATGGGLPVEIWSRVMRVAHQGVPVAALPDTSSGFSIATILQPAAAPVPPAPIGAPAAGRGERNTGIDNWLLDRLFGGRR
jgi:penicillin-binding protein 1A